MTQPRHIYIGFDSREISAYFVTHSSFRRHAPGIYPRALELSTLRQQGLYRRPTTYKDGRLYDVISEHPMATEFANSRFLVPHLARHGWALFTDCDMLARRSLDAVFDAYNDPGYAVYCVKHNHQPTNDTKMIGQVQSRYNRKNWSSVCLWNCDHPSNKKLTLDLINSVPGRDLHRFCWLEDDEIGELPPECNYLVGVTQGVADPILVHYTDGTPHMPGYEDCEYAQEWYEELNQAVPPFLRSFGALW